MEVWGPTAVLLHSLRSSQETDCTNKLMTGLMMLCRMRHPGGIQELLQQMHMHFHVPPARGPSGDRAAQVDLFATFIYLTQV